MKKSVPHNCSKCGRFIGPDGYLDIVYDDYAGGYEEGYSLCGRCLRKEKADNPPPGGEKKGEM